MLSMQIRKEVIAVSLTAAACFLVWFVQLLLLNKVTLWGAAGNLPLTLTIIWGLVFGSRVPEVSPAELRSKSTFNIFIHQSLRGSISGALVGAFCGTLYACLEPVFPLCFPLLGWIAGYFYLGKTSKETLLCIPFTLLGTILAETIMAWQLMLTNNAYTMERLFAIALPEATLNALFAPLLYLPLRHLHDISA